MLKNHQNSPSYSSPRRHIQYTQKNMKFTRKNQKVSPFPNLKEFLFYLVPFSHNQCFPANFFLSKWTTFAYARGTTSNSGPYSNREPSSILPLNKNYI